MIPSLAPRHGLSPLAASASGLSPLARGTQFFCGQRGQRLRFIPAGAGNTIFLRPARPAPPVYPRWRGEHVVSPVDLAVKIGLSPLTIYLF
ncbi:hypothetical protein SA43_0739 [Salmonella enterica subsp. enterica serovar Agona str. 43.E.09]|nr:hypothetical protein SA43_0739 [Salmonella enterica subsp. enterica serovar Agona str. 43.E.09]